ncbi:MAG: hypothetical protein LBF86_04410 [Helicobacteraceae bacterium]|jgi:hypothetical protein|nr:hypothetical protein [Helicobacteraceae bacterium]
MEILIAASITAAVIAVVLARGFFALVRKIKAFFAAKSINKITVNYSLYR